jgi:hypothetical protein
VSTFLIISAKIAVIYCVALALILFNASWALSGGLAFLLVLAFVAFAFSPACRIPLENYGTTAKSTSSEPAAIFHSSEVEANVDRRDPDKRVEG